MTLGYIGGKTFGFHIRFWRPDIGGMKMGIGNTLAFPHLQSHRVRTNVFLFNRR